MQARERGAVRWNKSSLTMSTITPPSYNSRLLGRLIARLRREALQHVGALFNVLPSIDEVLGDADAGRRARDRDLAHS